MMTEEQIKTRQERATLCELSAKRATRIPGREAVLYMWSMMDAGRIMYRGTESDRHDSRGASPALAVFRNGQLALNLGSER